jgi:hypothetical protein
MNLLKMIGIATIGWIGILFTVFLYYIAIAGLIKLL